MNGNSHSKHRGPLFAVIVLIAALMGLYFAFRKTTNSPAPKAGSNIEAPSAASSQPTSSAPVLTSKIATPAKTSATIAPSGPKTEKQLADELLDCSGWHGAITAEQAEKFKQNLAELINRGAASVPAIRALLDKNMDSNFNQVPGGDQLGYASLRASLFDALKQIGGPEAQAVMAQALQTSALPGEVLQLAQNLDQQAPGQYREQILNAARETLALAATNTNTNGVGEVDRQPAQRVLQNYSGDNTPEEIAKNYPEKFADAVSLANQPDGQGLPDLIKMSQDPSGGSKNLATEMIAQMAGNNEQAMDTLVQWAQKGQIPNATLVQLAPILAGTGEFQPGKTEPTDLATTADIINQRLPLIDKLLSAVEPNSSADHALRAQRDILTARLK